MGLQLIDRVYPLGTLHSLYSNFFLLLAITKSIMIAIRYAYTSQDNLRKLSERKLYRDELQLQYLINCWAKTTPSIVQNEIRESMWRNNVEDWDFKLTFGELPPQHLLNKITRNDIGYDFQNSFDLSEYCKQMKAMVRDMRQYFVLSTSYNERVARSLYGKNVKVDFKDYSVDQEKLENSRTIKSCQEMRSSCRSLPRIEDINGTPPPVVQPNSSFVDYRELTYQDLITETSASKMLRQIILASLPWRPNITMICVWYCIGHELVPIISLALDHQNLLHLNWPSYLFLGVFTIANFVIYFDITRLCMVGLIDFERRRFLMRTLSRMIYPEPVNHYQLNQFVPTINIYDSKSIYCWYEMRKVCISVGEKYLVKILSSFFFVTIGVIVALLLLILKLFNLLNMNLPATFLVGILYHSTIFFVYIMRMIFMGAQINNFAAKHKQILLEQWYQMKSIENKGVHVFLSSNLRCEPLQKMQKWMNVLAQEEGEDEIYARLNASIKALKVVIRKVSHDEEKGNLKILGVTLSPRLVKAIYGFVLSILVAYLIEVTLGFS